MVCFLTVYNLPRISGLSNPCAVSSCRVPGFRDIAFAISCACALFPQRHCQLSPSLGSNLVTLSKVWSDCSTQNSTPPCPVISISFALFFCSFSHQPKHILKSSFLSFPLTSLEANCIKKQCLSASFLTIPLVSTA